MSQPDYFKLACDATRTRAEELTRACFQCHEDNSGTVMLCALHAQSVAFRSELEHVMAVLRLQAPGLYEAMDDARALLAATQKGA